MIEVTGVVTRAHYMDFTRIANAHVKPRLSFMGRWGGLVAIAIAGIFLGILSFGTPAPVGEGILLSGLQLSMVGLWAGILTTFAGVHFYQSSYFKKFLSGDGHVLGLRTFKLTDDELIVRGAHFESRVRWDGFLSVSAHKSLVAVWLDPGVAYLIPREAIGDDIAVGHLIEFIKGRIPRKV